MKKREEEEKETLAWTWLNILHLQFQYRRMFEVHKSHDRFCGFEIVKCSVGKKKKWDW